MKVSAVIPSWNRKAELEECLNSVLNQTYKVDEIIVVDNYSSDGSIEMIQEKFPEVKLIVLPDFDYGACEALNIGFSTAQYDYIAILDDDVVLPDYWIEKILLKFSKEPESTAMISTKVVEPGMPKSYLESESTNTEKYIGTFVGCGSVVKKIVMDKAGYYDKKFFIHVNERDLAGRILNLGYKIKHYPEVETYHKKPFGIHFGKRSLFYHIRNYIWCIIKNYPLDDIFKIVLYALKSLFIKKESKNINTLGTIKLADNIFQTKNGVFITIKAVIFALLGVSHCLKNRRPCNAAEYKLIQNR